MVSAFVGVSMRVLGIDQSSKLSGYAVIDEDGFPTVWGIVDYSGEDNVPLRIKAMFLDLVNIMRQENCDDISVEAQFFNGNAKAYSMLCQLQGALIGFAYVNGMAVSSPLPSEWRSQLGFRQGGKVKRAELKAQAIQYVKENFGLDVTEDEAEAICIGRAEYLRLNS